MNYYDLHSHSTASDGSLSPSDLVELASKSNVNCFSLTDHDCIDGINEAQLKAKSLNLEFIAGIEFSVSWQQYTIHIVGLNIDITHLPLIEGTQKLKNYRLWRAEQISSRLSDAGIKNALDGAQKFSTGKMIGRMHFANFLIKEGYCKDVRAVFKKYLVKNKPGFIHGEWETLENVVSWINGAGGIAVIAHPCRYPFKNKKLKMLINDFKDVGGKGIEVISATANAQEVRRIKELSIEFELYASIGSDFHNPEYKWNKMGKLPPLPSECVPVWSSWESSSLI